MSGPGENGSAQGEWRPAVSPWIITAAVMLPTFMEVLDTTIVTVAVPHMAGSLAASNEEATWVLTSYLISNAIILPASGWLALYFGRKRFLLTCIVLFTIASVCSGMASSLNMLIAARVIQGAGGGALQPISQAILLESFPPQRRGMAMAAFAVGVVFAPIVGPVLGGWLTDNYSWRWAFYINIPIGMIAVFMINTFIEDPPYIKGRRPKTIDWTGFGYMAVALATLQVVLDRGQQDNWFEASWIRWFAAICFVAFVLFLIRELRTREPIVHLRVFKDRNFAVGTFLIFLVGIALYSAITLIPLFLQTLMGYPALNSGMALSPRGLGAIVTMPVVGYLTGKVDFRKLIGIGFFIVAVSLWLLGGINLEITVWNIGLPNILQGIGLSLLFVPLATVAVGTLEQKEIGNATGIFNLMRNVGGSAGISLIITYLTRHQQTNQMVLGSNATQFNLPYRFGFEALRNFFTGQAGAAGSYRMGQFFIYQSLQRQSTLLAFVQSFRLLALLCLFCIAAAFLFKRLKREQAPAART